MGKVCVDIEQDLIQVIDVADLREKYAYHSNVFEQHAKSLSQIWRLVRAYWLSNFSR